MSAVPTSLRRPVAPPLPPELIEGRLMPSLATRARQNWVLYAFVVLIPLQNIYSGYIPNFGGGVNFLNLMFAGSLLLALHCGGRLVRGYGVNGWAFAFIALTPLALVVGIGTVTDPSGHGNALKDQLIGMSFLFLAQMSATDWGSIRRLLLASLIPLPYTLRVVHDQHSSVSAWHYDHAMRIAGTFPELGSNEFAAYCATAMVLATVLLLSLRLRLAWRALLITAVICAGTGVALTYSRTAYIAIFVAFGLMVMLRRQARARLIVLGLFALLIVPPLLPNSVIQRFESIAIAEEERDESTDSRFVFWAIAWERFTERPILGTGYHTFHHAEVNPLRMDTHNFFLRELVEKGLVGAIVLAGLLWSVFRLLWRGHRRAPLGSWTYGLCLGLLCAFAAVMVGNLFGDRFTHYPMIAHFWLYVGLALRAVALQREQSLREHKPPEPIHAPAH
jgi:putative inorganic carbon (hco3(-)) transporter